MSRPRDVRPTKFLRNGFEDANPNRCVKANEPLEGMFTVWMLVSRDGTVPAAFVHS